MLSSLFGFEWRPRFDGDVIQRCLTVWFLSRIVLAILNSLPMCIGFWVENSCIELWTTIILVAAILKSSLQLPVDNKAVLITGENSS